MEVSDEFRPSTHQAPSQDRMQYTNALEKQSSPPLKLEILMQWTRFNPPVPRNTVQDYLATLREVDHRFLPLKDPELSPGPALRPPSPPTWSTSDRDEDFGFTVKADTALVLHPGTQDTSRGILVQSRAKNDDTSSKAAMKQQQQPQRKSVVGSLKPKSTRHSTGTSHNALPAQERRTKQLQPPPLPPPLGPPSRSKSISGTSSASPILVARLDERGHAQVEGHSDSLGVLQPQPTQELERSRSPKPRRESRQNATASRKDNPREHETKPRSRSRRTQTTNDKGKGKDPQSEDTDELEERLRARRERRRAKALIVKDKTKTASAMGASAAAKVKLSRRKKVRKDLASEVDVEEEPTRTTRQRRGQRSSLGAARTMLTEQQKAVNIGPSSRLTIKPGTKVGLFGKGAASAKTRVPTRCEPVPRASTALIQLTLGPSHAVADLVFSENDFLNAPRRSPTPSTSSSSSSSSKNALPDSEPHSKPAKVTNTYGTKGKKRRSSTTPKIIEARPSSTSSLSSISMQPPPPPKRHAKSMKENSGQTRDNSRIPSATTTIRVLAVEQHGRSLPRSPLAASPASRASPERDTASLHSAYSLKQRRAAHASASAAFVADAEAQPGVAESGRADGVEDVVLQTSAFWKTGLTASRAPSELQVIDEEDVPAMSSPEYEATSMSPRPEGIGAVGTSSIARMLAECSDHDVERAIGQTRQPGDVDPFQAPASYGSSRHYNDPQNGIEWRSPTLAAREAHQLYHDEALDDPKHSLNMHSRGRHSNERVISQPTFSDEQVVNDYAAFSSSQQSLGRISENGGFRDVIVEGKAEGGRDDDDQAFRSAMRQHWYRARC